jgi:hypothetical protein
LLATVTVTGAAGAGVGADRVVTDGVEVSVVCVTGGSELVSVFGSSASRRAHRRA